MTSSTDGNVADGDPAVEYARLVRAALTAMTEARLYWEQHRPGPDQWRSIFRDLWTLDTLDSQGPDESSWWSTSEPDATLAALVRAGTVNESLLVEHLVEALDDEVESALKAAGLLAHEDDEVCGSCGRRWPDGTGEVIDCENEGCPGSCPNCENMPCPYAKGAEDDA